MEELVQKAEALKREEHKARKEVEKFEIVAPVPEKYDYYGFITISEMDDEKTAEQTLENTRLLPTAGPLDLPVPGGRTTVREALKSDAMKGFMTEEQIKAAEAAMGEMEKEIKTKFPKEVKFQRGKYQGADVVFAEGESERPTPLNVKESEDINKVFHSARVGRFIISGDLLRTVNAFSLGASSCDSLHEFETETDVMSEGGMTFYTKTIRPVKSTLVKEGYLYKEEIDEIFRTVFVALGSDPKVPPNMKNEL